MSRFKALGCFLLSFALPAAALAQTYTVTSGSPTTLSITNVHAGDTVTLAATLFSGDPNENGEGEPLIVQLPGGPFSVAAYFAPQQINFIALQDGQTVSAYIQGADGDESAQVTFTVNAKRRFTQEEKDHFAKLAALYGGAAGLLGTVGGICGLAPEPTATKVCAVVGLVGAGVSGLLAARYGFMAADPYDPNYRIIYLPIFLTVAPILAQPGITQAEADAANAWLLNQENQLAFAEAIIISIDRANSASQDGDTIDEAKQMRAAADYAIQLSGFVGAAAGTRTNLVSAIQAAGFSPITATANDVFNFELSLLFFGLPPVIYNTLVTLGADPDTIAFVTGLLIVQDVSTTAGTFPDFLNNPSETAAEQAVAADLLSFAGRNGGEGGIPLTPGQMVQAQGWVSNGAGKTTFAIEAQVAPQKKLLGKLEVNDHNGFSINHGDVSRALLVGQGAFLVTGTYVAADGSSQTWTARGDAEKQSIAISTSENFSASGTLGGGNVAIRR
jgi:hypothetical protein